MVKYDQMFRYDTIGRDLSLVSVYLLSLLVEVLKTRQDGDTVVYYLLLSDVVFVCLFVCVKILNNDKTKDTKKIPNRK